MKKLLIVALVLFFWSIGSAFACNYHEKELTSTQPAQAIVLVELNDKRVELLGVFDQQKRYNVTTSNGETLATNLSKEDLSVQFPKLYQALEG